MIWRNHIKSLSTPDLRSIRIIVWKSDKKDINDVLVWFDGTKFSKCLCVGLSSFRKAACSFHKVKLSSEHQKNTFLEP